MKKTFAGITSQYDKLDNANIILQTIAYDKTSTWGKGAAGGPAAFLEASEHMELYDIETDSEVFRKGIHLCPPLDLNEKTPEDMYDMVLETAEDVLSHGKFPTFFGGEHSISIPIIDAFLDHYKDLTVLHIDAHTDLRPEYEGSAFNHACAMYRASQKANLVQVGIRSMDGSEMEYINREQCYFAHDIYDNTYWRNEALKLITSPVYISFDLDALDPSILPDTGTPEPGGLDWYSTLEFLRMVFNRKNVVGFDIVELCPNENSRASDFLAAKLYYKMLTYKYFGRY
ncbi:MAG: agmatinase [Saprospiraceae bacterium]|nr:agmatinase [Saprospiraceae bacterium]